MEKEAPRGQILFIIYNLLLSGLLDVGRASRPDRNNCEAHHEYLKQ